MKKKLFAFFTALCMTASMLPVTALAAEGAPSQLYVGNQPVISGNAITYWTTGTDGKLTESNESGNWNVKYDPATVTLTLRGATIQGGTNTGYVTFGSGIYALCSSNQPVALTIELIGTNTITGNYGIYVNANQGTTSGTDASLVIKNGGDNGNNGSLTVTGTGNSGLHIISGTGDASLTIKNVSVVANATSSYSGSGVCVQSGASATGTPNISLSVDGGSLTASGTGNSDGILFNVGNSSVSATTSLTVSANAIVRANGGIANNSSSPIQYATGSDSTGGIVFDGSAGTVYGNVTLDKSLTINEGETLTVPDGSSLNCNGKLTNNGTINVESGGTVSGQLKNGTTVTTPSISVQPQNKEVTAGETAEFSVTASAGSETPTYQWQQKTAASGSDWTDINSATSASYTTETTTTSMSGYQYRCVVTGSGGVSVISQAATLTVQQASVPIPPQPTDPTTPETTAPTDADHTVQTDNSGHAPVEDNTALPSFWDLVTQRINATPRGGEITINMGARAVPDSVLNALRARSLTATFRYGDTELTLAPDQLPPEGMRTEWTLHELGNYVTEADKSIRISEEKSEAQNATATETTTPAADTGKPNPATGETATTAAALLVAVVALTGMGITLKRR